MLTGRSIETCSITVDLAVPRRPVFIYNITEVREDSKRQRDKEYRRGKEGRWKESCVSCVVLWCKLCVCECECVYVCVCVS